MPYFSEKQPHRIHLCPKFQRQHEYRFQQESLPRLLYRRKVRGGRVAARLGVQSDSRRAGTDQEAYVVVLEGELYLLGMHITPLISASTHVKPDATRTRKLLLHRRQIDTLIGKVERAGYALVPIDLHYSKGRIKAEIGLAKGKKLHDKRDSEKEKDWKREQGRLLKTQVR